jgi:hypothetical protein
MIRNAWIELLASEKRKGIALPMQVYDQIKLSIIKSIKNRPEGSIPLHKLLEDVTNDLAANESNIQPWHILQVKIDLHERGFLRLNINRDKMQVVKLRHDLSTKSIL